MRMYAGGSERDRVFSLFLMLDGCTGGNRFVHSSAWPKCLKVIPKGESPSLPMQFC